MMALQLSHSDLEQLQSWLGQYLPATFKLYHELRGHLQGRFPDLIFFVDRWPEPQAVVAVVNPTGKQLICREFYGNMTVGVFGVTGEALAALLRDSGLVDWNKTFFFACAADSQWPALTSLIEEKGGQSRHNPCFIMRATQESLKSVPVPEGVAVSEVTEETAHLVDSTWEFASPLTGPFVRHTLRHNPSCLLTAGATGDHVGHMLGQSYGAMGMLYVQPPFRRQGHAKVILSQLARRYFEEGEDAYALVECNNEPSMKLHLSMGFEPVPAVKVAWVFNKPNTAQAPLSLGCCGLGGSNSDSLCNKLGNGSQ